MLYFYLNSNEITENIGFVKWDASSRWSFGPNSACGSIESPTILTTHPILIDWIFHLCHRIWIFLATESIKNFSSSFQSIDNIQSSNSFALCMLGIGNSITNYIFEKNTKNTTSFFQMVQFQDLNSSSPFYRFSRLPVQLKSVKLKSVKLYRYFEPNPS